MKNTIRKGMLLIIAILVICQNLHVEAVSTLSISDSTVDRNNAGDQDIVADQKTEEEATEEGGQEIFADDETQAADPASDDLNTQSGESRNERMARQYLTASDFKYGVNEGVLDTAKVIKLSKVSWDEVRVAGDLLVDQGELGIINEAIVNKQLGTYPLTITDTLGNQKVIQVELFSIVVRNPANDQQIGANHFEMTWDEVASVDMLKSRSKVYAMDAAGNSFPISSISWNQADLDLLNNAIMGRETGDYIFTFNSPDGQRVDINIRLNKGRVTQVEQQENNATGSTTTSNPRTTGQNVKRVRAVKTGDAGTVWSGLAAVLSLTVMIYLLKRER